MWILTNKYNVKVTITKLNQYIFSITIDLLWWVLIIVHNQFKEQTSCPSEDSPSQNCDPNTAGRSNDRVRLQNLSILCTNLVLNEIHM